MRDLPPTRTPVRAVRVPTLRRLRTEAPIMTEEPRRLLVFENLDDLELGALDDFIVRVRTIARKAVLDMLAEADQAGLVPTGFPRGRLVDEFTFQGDAQRYSALLLTLPCRSGGSVPTEFFFDDPRGDV
jgi:hypothetical protein